MRQKGTSTDMIWRMKTEAPCASLKCGGSPEGRFIVHRHRDAAGVHLDLRLEAGDHLLGWRIDGDELENGALATEKPPHPLRWLEEDDEAERVDSGSFSVLRNGPDEKTVLLHGERNAYCVALCRETDVTPAALRSLLDAALEAGCSLGDLGQLVADGAVARKRAIARLCGLGRELDGHAFDEAGTRHMMRALSLDEIHRQLRAYEVRFDQKYPPRPVSRPEALDEGAEGHQRAMEILKT